MHRVKDTKKITGREMNEQPVLACIHTRDSACIIQETYLFLDLDWAVVEIFCSLSLQNKKYSESFQTLPHVCCYCTKTSMSADKADKHINPSVSSNSMWFHHLCFGFDSLKFSMQRGCLPGVGGVRGNFHSFRAFIVPQNWGQQNT